MCIFLFVNQFWLMFGKLWEARSRLYRSRFLQVNTSTRLKALDEIYNIYTRLHRSEFRNSAEVRQTFSHVLQFNFRNLIFTYFNMRCPKFTNVHEKNPEIQEMLRKRPKFRRFFSNFLRFRNESCWFFRKWFSKS